MLHDGMGLVAKRLEHVPSSDPPRVRIISDNLLYAPYEGIADEINIVGRIRWFARELCMTVFREIGDSGPALAHSPMVRTIEKTFGYIAKMVRSVLPPSEAFRATSATAERRRSTEIAGNVCLDTRSRPYQLRAHQVEAGVRKAHRAGVAHLKFDARIAGPAPGMLDIGRREIQSTDPADSVAAHRPKRQAAGPAPEIEIPLPRLERAGEVQDPAHRSWTDDGWTGCRRMCPR